MKYYLGVDAGTTNVKAALLDEHFTAVDRESAAVVNDSPFTGACETDMEDYWAAVCRVLRNLMARSGDRQVAGMCVVGQGDGCWPLDGAGCPVRPAILWNDTRAKALDRLPDPEYDRIAHANGANGLLAGSVGAILCWLRQFEPESFGKIRWALHCKDFLNFRLTGVVCTDITDASTALTDVLNSRYVPQLLDRLELPERILPPIRESAEIVGRVTVEAAAATGLPEGLPVACGALDVCGTAVGSDLLRPGMACSVIGTTLANQMVLDETDARSGRARVLLVRHAVPGLYVNILSTLSGTTSLDYGRQLFCPEGSWDEADALAETAPPGCGGLVFLPYLRGERAPFTNPFASGSYAGIRPEHTRAHFLRAAYEGLAYSFRDCFGSFPREATETYLAGGGAQNDFLARMFADLLGQPCLRVREREQGILGAVRILWKALGQAEDFNVFPTLEADRFEPRPAEGQAYREGFARFVAVRRQMEPIYEQLG